MERPLSEASDPERLSATGQSLPSARFHRLYLVAAASCVIAGAWIRPAVASLWLDELGTWWVIKDGIGDTIDRALEYHGQSPAYYVLEWLIAQAVARSEVGLRALSLIAMAGATWALFRIMRRLVGVEAARLAAVGFVGIEGVAFAAGDARPYAVATLLLVTAVLACVRWLDEGRILDGGLFVALAVGTVWMHYLFAAALIPIAIYGFSRRGESQVKLPQLSLAWATVALGILPLVPQLVLLASRGGALSVPMDGSVVDFLSFAVPPVLAGGLVLGLLAARVVGPVSFERKPAAPRTLVLLSTWVVLPPTVLFLTSMLADVSLYAPRYYVSAAPAAAGLFGWALSTVQPSMARRVAVVVFAILAVLGAGGQLKNGEDWRSAAAAVRAIAADDTPVFLHAALVESAQVDWLTDPEHASYLMSPASFYTFDGKLIPMPYLLKGDEAFAYLEEITEREIAGNDRFLLVSRYPFVPFKEWWDGRLAPEGWFWRSIGTYGYIEIIEFRNGGLARLPG